MILMQNLLTSPIMFYAIPDEIICQLNVCNLPHAATYLIPMYNVGRNGRLG